MIKKTIEFIKKTFVRILIILWTIASAFMSNSYLCDYYQKKANSHFEGYQLIQMGPIFICASICAIVELKKKNVFLAIIMSIISIWAFYFLFIPSFQCYDCTYGG